MKKNYLTIVSVLFFSALSFSQQNPDTEPADAYEPVYFWMLDGSLTANTPLINLDATYSALGRAIMQYQSCLTGYPYTSSSPYWRKAAMERRDSPTDLNYRDGVNNNIGFDQSNMTGLQIKQPFESNGVENRMIFNIPSTGFRDIKFAFALKDEGAANAVVVDYSSSTSNPQWITTGLTASSIDITSDYQLYEIDLSNVPEADDNTNLKIRLRFAGEDMTADNGGRVTFNNISVLGISLTADVDKNELLAVKLYPNPVNDVLTIAHNYDAVNYTLFTTDGKIVREGILQNNQLDVAQLNTGVYLLRLVSNEKSVIKKFVKQ